MKRDPELLDRLAAIEAEKAEHEQAELAWQAKWLTAAHAASDNGWSQRDIAKRVGISGASVNGRLQSWQVGPIDEGDEE